MAQVPLPQRLTAECFGTAWLVLRGCRSFLLIILGATHERAPQHFGPVAIGLGLTLIHLISIPVTNTSVNPARSTGTAVGGWALGQLWLFWVAPIVGGIVGGLVYPQIVGREVAAGPAITGKREPVTA